jgi:2-dehydro-3-deoxyphosphooctonate aldolase (KDO 8-P synthase)
MEKFTQPMKITEDIVLGSGKPVLFAGPCAVESFDICMEIGGAVKEYAAKLGFSYVFKASFDKANRTSSSSFRNTSVLLVIRVELFLPRTASFFTYGATVGPV